MLVVVVLQNVPAPAQALQLEQPDVLPSVHNLDYPTSRYLQNSHQHIREKYFFFISEPLFPSRTSALFWGKTFSFYPSPPSHTFQLSVNTCLID